MRMKNRYWYSNSVSPFRKNIFRDKALFVVHHISCNCNISYFVYKETNDNNQKKNVNTAG